MSTNPRGIGSTDDHIVTVLVAGDPARTDPLRVPDRELTIVGHVATGNDAINTVLTELPDIILLDVRIDDADARAVCRRVREWAPATRAVLATPFDDERAYTTLVAGASGAVLLGADDETMTRTVCEVARGESVLLPRMAGRVMHDIDAWARRAADPIHPPPTLTPTEREVLHSLSEGVDPAEIARIHAVTTRLVNLHAGFAVAKLHRYVHGGERIAADRQAGAG
ncbi:MAG: response regulator transcription factor [Acidimicrobiales bacterium]